MSVLEWNANHEALAKPHLAYLLSFPGKTETVVIHAHPNAGPERGKRCIESRAIRHISSVVVPARPSHLSIPFPYFEAVEARPGRVWLAFLELKYIILSWPTTRISFLRAKATKAQREMEGDALACSALDQLSPWTKVLSNTIETKFQILSTKYTKFQPNIQIFEYSISCLVTYINNYFDTNKPK